MNLVIDEAVEVKQVTKTNPEEKRRSLGTNENPTTLHTHNTDTGNNSSCIWLTLQQDKYCSKETTCRLSRRLYEEGSTVHKI